MSVEGGEDISGQMDNDRARDAGLLALQSDIKARVVPFDQSCYECPINPHLDGPLVDQSAA
ncbi:hypothetical protein ACWCQL_26065 [Streptomyces sp. NPDC002073]